MLDLIGINFRNCGISIDPGIADDVFDVGNVPFERSPEAAVSHGAATGALVAILLTKKKHKFGNFDRPLGLHGHRRRCV